MYLPKSMLLWVQSYQLLKHKPNHNKFLAYLFHSIIILYIIIILEPMLSEIQIHDWLPKKMNTTSGMNIKSVMT